MKSMKTHHPHLLYQVFLTQSYISKLYMELCLMHIVDNPLLTSVSTKLCTITMCSTAINGQLQLSWTMHEINVPYTPFVGLRVFLLQVSHIFCLCFWMQFLYGSGCTYYQIDQYRRMNWMKTEPCEDMKWIKTDQVKQNKVASRNWNNFCCSSCFLNR